MAKERKATAKDETFEQLYERLEASVAKLEQGGLPLDDAIALYEEGMLLARACQEHLDGAEQRITVLKVSFSTTARNDGGMLNGGAAAEDIEYVPDDEIYEAPDDLP
jgi:exodeoxyribonuclease VII small subunit